jgi:hypothetical protein
VVFIPNPHSMDLPWERAVKIRLEPFMTLKTGEDLYSGLQLWLMLNPARFPMLLEGTGHKADDLLTLLKEGKPLPHFDLAWRLAAKVDAKVSDIVSENVVGVLPGSDAALRAEHVVLTAHLDHLGVASVGEGDRVFNGAIDNASGIAVILQIARDLAKKKAPRRTIVFVAVTAEELGLLGSRAYVNDARSRGQQIVANLNTDMFMPIYPMKQVVVFGLEESDLADDARWIAAELGIDVQSDPQPQRNRFIRSDQYSFIRVGIPALATKIGYKANSPQAEIDSKWFAERYHAVSDSADQPVDLAAGGQIPGIRQATGGARCESQSGAALVRHQRVLAPRGSLADQRRNGFSPSRIHDPRRPASQRSRRPDLSMREMRREHLQEIVDVASQQHTASEARPGGVHREQV